MYGTPPSDLDPDETQTVRIEIIPLIDVIFFLLATFVLFTLSLDRREVIPLTLPKVDERPVIKIDPAEPVLLQVSGNGDYYWDRELLSLPQVKARLADYARKADAKVMLASDDSANYGDTIRLLDAVRFAGIEEVSIETRYRPRGQ